MTDWFKETSASPYIRTNRTPNVRDQDGPKRRLFCAECEQIIGRYEKAFSDDIFRAYNKDSRATIHYDDSFVRFCASISLRVLLFYEGTPNDHLTEEQAQNAARAVTAWRQLVLGEIASPGQYEQHFLPLDVIQTASFPDLPSNFNRYLIRALDLDLVAGRAIAFTYAKLARFCIIGIIQQPATRAFRGTRVALRRGSIYPRQYQVPAELGEFMIAKAKKVAGTYAAMSQRQRDRVIETVRANPNRTAQSDTYRAIAADVHLFGDEVFWPDEPDHD